MPRKNLVRTSHFPYHITTRSNQRQWFVIDLKDVWEITLNSLYEANNIHPVRIHGFVLMGNHYHLVVDTPDSNIDKFMYEFNKRFSLALRISSGKINKMFGGRYKRSLIQNRSHYLNVLKYVYRNPVKANIVNRVESYRFSTLYAELKHSSLPFRLHSYVNVYDYLEWFNSNHTDLQNESIKKGLKKTVFNYSGTRERRAPPCFDSF